MKFLIIGFVFFLGSVKNSFSREVNSATQKLFDLTLDIKASAPSMDLNEVKKLVARGADVHALNSGGASAFIVAVESYGYLAAQKDPRANSAKLVAEYLMEAGSDISLVDGRGGNALDYLISWSPKTELMFEILKKGPKFDFPNPHGRTSLHAMAARTDPEFALVAETILTHAEALHANPLAEDEDGVTPILVAAGKGSKDGAGKLILERLLALLPKDQITSAVNHADRSGMSPLMVAISTKNDEVVDDLLTHYKINLEVQNTDDETALSIAESMGNTALVNRLKALGAKDVPVDHELSCRNSNRGNFGINQIKDALYGKCKGQIHTVNDFLKILLNSLKSHYTYLYGTQGLGKSTPDSPRAILYGRDGKLVVSFGDAKLDGPDSESLEFYAFDDEKKKFEFFEILFPKKGGLLTYSSNQKPRLSEANPAMCSSCHGLPARPIWNTWSLWPGTYHGEMEALYSSNGERSDYEAFQKHIQSDKGSRYRNILPQAIETVKSGIGSYVLSFSGFTRLQNLSLDFLVSGLMAERISRELHENQKLQSVKYGVLAALSCEDPISNYISIETQKKIPRTEEEIMTELKALGKEEMQSRFDRQNVLRPGDLNGRYNYQASHKELESVLPKASGFSSDIPRLTNLRFLVEGILGNGAMAGWFTPFNDNRPNYSTISLNDLEIRAWKELLDPVKDQELITLYQSVQNKIKIAQIPMWIHDLKLPVQKELCALLKTKGTYKLH